jgi:predicted glycosyltransferase
MKLWFDISNSPHVNLFSGLLRELKQDGHELTITCRPLANTVDLLRLERLEYSLVGEHHGKNIIRKSLGFPIRVSQLYKHLVSEGIHAAISQSSFHAPVASRLLGIPSIYMNDNEHALGNIPAFLTAERIFIPEYLELKKVARQGANLKKVRQYPGIKEGIYLWRLAKELDSGPYRQAKTRPSVYIRPEPWTAQYYRGRTNFLDNIIVGLGDAADVVVLPRGAEQRLHYMDKRSNRVTVIEGALSIQEIARDCDLFIGAGGTMTREMAVLGVPTVSVYQDKLLDVDRHLLRVGAFMHEPNLTPASALDRLDAAIRRGKQRELLEKGQEAYKLLKEELLGLRS